MQIRCPHCQVAIELVDTEAGSEVTCPKCGSVVSSVEATVLEPLSGVPSAGAGRSTIDLPPPATGSSQAAPATDMSDEKRFGRFRLLKLLGKGSFGEVWRAHDPELQREVALKFPRPGKEKNFVREAQAAARLKHPHIVTVFEVGEAPYHGQDKWPYIASEFIHGQDLAKVLASELEAGRAMTPKRVAELCRQVAEALHAAHEAGVVHRDLKPLNILIDDNDQPRVMDFGMAKRETEAEYVQTIEGDVFGTPAYMSPEQTRDSHAVDRRTDVWALGIILFELLTGERPFRGERDQKLLLDQIRREDPPPPSKLNSQVPADLDTLCLKCLEKDPSRRFPTAADLAQELHRFLDGQPIHSRPITQWERARKWCQRNPVVASLSAAVILVLLTGIGVSSFFALQSAARNRDLLKQTTRANQKADEARRKSYSGHMSLIQRNWEIPQVELVLDSLEKTRPQPGETDLRGFEWHYWDHLCHSSLLDLSGGTVVAFSPDGKRLASASSDRTWGSSAVKVWDAVSGAELLTLIGHGQAVNSVAFSPDGKRLASASSDRKVKVWDAASGAELLTFRGHTGTAVTSVAFSLDGKRVASGGNDSTVKVWDAVSGAELLTLKGHTNEVRSVTFSPDGKRLASADQQTVKVWDATSGTESLTLKGVGFSIAFSPDGKRLASPSSYGTVKVWDATSGAEILTLKGHSRLARSVAFSPDGKRVASGGDDQTAKVWDATSGAELLTLKGHTDIVSSVAFSPDGKRLASASFDATGTVKVWDATIGVEIIPLKGHFGSVGNVAFSPDGKRLASAGDDWTVKVWDAMSGAESLTLKGHAGIVRSVAFSPDGKRLASIDNDGTVKVWDAMSGAELLTLKGDTGSISSVAFSPDGKRLASVGSGMVKVWDAANGAELLTLRACFSVAFSPDGKQLVSVVNSEPAKLTVGKVLDTTNGLEVLTLKIRRNVSACMVFSPDGKRLASPINDQEVNVWDATSGAEVLTLKGHTGLVSRVVFSPDGKRLASASWDQTVKVWDAASGTELLTLKGHTGRVHSVAFSPDGKRLASTGDDATVIVWDSRSWTPELRAEREVQSLNRVLVERLHVLANRLLLKEDIAAAVESDPTISEPQRKRMLELTDGFEAPPFVLIDHCWPVVSKLGNTPENYQRALLLAENAARKGPTTSVYLQALGVAQYRVGQYEQALETLTRSDALNPTQANGPDPVDLAVLAMTHHKLGHTELAQQFLNRLRVSLQQPYMKDRANPNPILQEAEALINPAPPPARPVAKDGREPIEYQPFRPDVWKARNHSTWLFPWEGERVVLLTTTADLDATTMTAYLKRLDAEWQRYTDLVGQSPT